MKIYSAVVASLLLFSVNAMADAVEDAAARVEAASRISPIMSKLYITKDGMTPEEYNVRVEGFQPGTYDLDWTMVGYNEGNFTTFMGVFDCRVDPAGECGDSFRDAAKFLDVDGSLDAPHGGVVTSDWSYLASNGVRVYANELTYHASFVIEPDGANGSEWNADSNTSLVFRWWQIAEDLFDPENPTKGGISILVGTEAAHYYDDNGRRLQSWVPPQDQN